MAWHAMTLSVRKIFFVIFSTAPDHQDLCPSHRKYLRSHAKCENMLKAYEWKCLRGLWVPFTATWPQHLEDVCEHLTAYSFDLWKANYFTGKQEACKDLPWIHESAICHLSWRYANRPRNFVRPTQFGVFTPEADAKGFQLVKCFQYIRSVLQQSLVQKWPFHTKMQVIMINQTSCQLQSFL